MAAFSCPCLRRLLSITRLERLMSSCAPAKVSERPEIPENYPAELAERIRQGDESAIGELYEMLSRGLGVLIRRQIQAQDAEDAVHDTILAVIQGIQKNGLRNPERLMGYVRTVMQRRIAERVNKLSASRSRNVDIDWAAEAVAAGTPEQQLIRDQNAAIVRTVLDSLPARYREVLTRFYVLEQTAEQIMQEMGLNPTQFRLMKSRAKAQFGKYGQRRFKKPVSIHVAGCGDVCSKVWPPPGLDV